MRSAAGGETGAPRAQRGTRLKATTERAFLVSLAVQRSTPKRLVHLASRAERVLPLQSKAASRPKCRAPAPCPQRTGGATARQPLTPAVRAKTRGRTSTLGQTALRRLAP